jgi:hypothetical protein
VQALYCDLQIDYQRTLLHKASIFSPQSIHSYYVVCSLLLDTQLATATSTIHVPDTNKAMSL